MASLKHLSKHLSVHMIVAVVFLCLTPWISSSIHWPCAVFFGRVVQAHRSESLTVINVYNSIDSFAQLSSHYVVPNEPTVSDLLEFEHCNTVL